MLPSLEMTFKVVVVWNSRFTSASGRQYQRKHDKEAYYDLIGQCPLEYEAVLHGKESHYLHPSL